MLLEVNDELRHRSFDVGSWHWPYGHRLQRLVAWWDRLAALWLHAQAHSLAGTLLPRSDHRAICSCSRRWLRTALSSKPAAELTMAAPPWLAAAMVKLWAHGFALRGSPTRVRSALTELAADGSDGGLAG